MIWSHRQHKLVNLVNLSALVFLINSSYFDFHIVRHSFRAVSGVVKTENDLRRITKIAYVKILLEVLTEGISCQFVVGKR